jgi:hypothetical protein
VLVGKSEGKDEREENGLSIATSTTSAPAAAQASMEATEIPAVSCEWTWMGTSGNFLRRAPTRLKRRKRRSISFKFPGRQRLKRERELARKREYAHGSSLGLEETSHVLDGEDMDTAVDELLGEVEVVLERVLRAGLGLGDVAGVAL